MAKTISEDFSRSVVGADLMGKSIKAVKALLEEIASNNYHRSNKRATPRKSNGKCKVDAVTHTSS